MQKVVHCGSCGKVVEKICAHCWNCERCCKCVGKKRFINGHIGKR